MGRSCKGEGDDRAATATTYARSLADGTGSPYTRITDYVDLRVEKVLVETRLARNESRLRDEDLLKRAERLEERVTNVEATQAVIIELQRQTVAALQTLTQRVEVLERRADAAEQVARDLTEQMRAMAEQIRDGFAAQGEQLGELAVRMGRLERGQNPPAAE
jgi:chaperonin cofactor prefoldin